MNAATGPSDSSEQNSWRVRVSAALIGCLSLLSSAVVAQESAPSAAELRSAQERTFDLLGVREAWDVTRGDPAVPVGVLDNGFDFFHPDLVDVVQPASYFSGGHHGGFFENLAHGTMVASIIVAKDDEVGMVGLAPQTRVLAASQGMIEHTLLRFQTRFFAEHPGAGMTELQAALAENRDEITAWGRRWTTYQILGAAKAIRDLTERGARVINISGALARAFAPSPEVWDELESAFRFAAEADVVVVLAAGNTAQRWDDYPGTAETVLVVGATKLDDQRWVTEQDMGGQILRQGSNYGPRLSVMAPVENIAVCEPHEQRLYHSDDGPMGPTSVPFAGPYSIRPIGATSCAAPIVSALAALVRAARPELSAPEVVQLILDGCDDLSDPGPDEWTGHGRVHFGRTLALAEER